MQTIDEVKAHCRCGGEAPNKPTAYFRLGFVTTSIFLCGMGGEGYILFIKNLQITTVFLAIYSDKLCEKEVALRILLFFLFYTFLCSTSSR